jgi:hypothetical protein
VGSTSTTPGRQSKPEEKGGQRILKDPSLDGPLARRPGHPERDHRVGPQPGRLGGCLAVRAARIGQATG